jgi:hypothetical protein
MKRSILALAVIATLGMTACSSTKKATAVEVTDATTSVPTGAQQAISEQRLASEFKRQGVKVIYSLNGKLEAIETVGYAPIWGGSQNAEREAFRVAELEAKKSLNDFINKETIRSTTSVQMISKNLEKASDNKTNNFATNRNRDIVASVASDEESAKAEGEINREENVALRKDALEIASRVNTTITTNNRGILGGLYLVEGDVVNDGKTVRVVYRWDLKHNPVRIQVRNMMAM